MRRLKLNNNKSMIITVARTSCFRYIISSGKMSLASCSSLGNSSSKMENESLQDINTTLAGLSGWPSSFPQGQAHLLLDSHLVTSFQPPSQLTAPGPLHLLSPLSEVLFPYVFIWLTSSFHQMSVQTSSCQRNFS